MVWGAIWKGGKSHLIIMERDRQGKRHGYTARSYQQALSEGLLPIYNGTRHFQQDNARIHTCEATTRWLQEHRIEYIDWPAHSPDLNPIEHVWRALKLNLKTMFPHLEFLKDNQADRDELIRCLHLAWAAIPLNLITKLIESLPRRLAAVRRAKGWYTKY